MRKFLKESLRVPYARDRDWKSNDSLCTSITTKAKS